MQYTSCTDLWKQIKMALKGFYIHLSAAYQCNFEAVSDSVCCVHKAAALWAACIWFHREVVNMPVFSTTLLFWHAQLRRSSSKVSAWGCGCCRSAFTHTNLQFSSFSPQYGWMLRRASPRWPWTKHCRTIWVELGSLRKVMLLGKLSDDSLSYGCKLSYLVLKREKPYNCFWNII